MPFSFFDLRRPQYPSSPEILLSSLAWSTVERNPAAQGTGLIYRRKDSSKSTRAKIEQTCPRGQEIAQFAESLRAQNLFHEENLQDHDLACAVINTLDAPLPRKGVGSASSAIGISGALLQDPVGGLGVANPPNFAHLLNTMYVLGGGKGETAASKWFGAARHFSTSTDIDRIERALSESVLKPYFADDEEWPPRFRPLDKSLPESSPAWWTSEVIEAEQATPFSWFRTSWDRLCSPEWYKVLPPRRWASWAICTLRHAVAFSFLWESSFFTQLAKGLLDEEADPEMVAKLAVAPLRPLIPHRQGTISQMDVNSTITGTLTIGLGAKSAVERLVKELDLSSASLADLVVDARTILRDEDRQGLNAALAGKGEIGGYNNLAETVRYSLMARDGIEDADNYGLLRTVSRRFTHVLPGPEWIVVMSALASTAPSSPLRLGDVIQHLDALGFRARIDFLLSELEKAGLCASAADGDEGIEIDLGFGEAR